MKILFVTNQFSIIRGNKRIDWGSFVDKRLFIYEKLGAYFDFVPTFVKYSLFVRIMANLAKVENIDYFPAEIHGKKPLTNYREGIVDLVIRKFFNRVEHRLEKFLACILPLVKSREYDIIYAHGMYKTLPAGLLAMKLSKHLKKPYVVHLHGSDVNYDMAKNPISYTEVLENAEKCIFVSNALLEKAKSLGYSGKNAIVTGNGYDPEFFKPMDKEMIRKELGVYEEGKRYVGFVGYLVSVKRADKFPEMFRYIAEREKNIKFIIVGDGPLRKKIEKEMKGLDYLITGIVPHEEVAKWMNIMDVMILPSRNEGFPTVINEAKACGVITVGSSNGGIPEAIGFNDLVVAEGEDFERRFAQKVVEILENGYDIEKLLKHAENYTWEKIVEKEYNICRSVLNTSVRGSISL